MVTHRGQEHPARATRRRLRSLGRSDATSVGDAEPAADPDRLRHGACSVNDLSTAVEMEQSRFLTSYACCAQWGWDRRPQRASVIYAL